MYPTISIIDDDEAVRIALRLLLLSFGWSAMAYASGREFLDSIERGLPDCLLLDLNMPGMNGAELQEALCSLGVEVPVVIITGQKDHYLIERARAAGASALLYKPVHDEDLKTCIERVLAP